MKGVGIEFFPLKVMFKDYLRAKRKAAKMTQVELAEKVRSLGYPCSNGTISYYETGYAEEKGWTGRPPEKLVEYLAKALNVPLGEIREEAGYSVHQVNQKHSTPPEILAVDWSQFNREQVEEISDFIEFKLTRISRPLKKEPPDSLADRLQDSIQNLQNFFSPEEAEKDNVVPFLKNAPDYHDYQEGSTHFKADDEPEIVNVGTDPPDGQPDPFLDEYIEKHLKGKEDPDEDE